MNPGATPSKGRSFVQAMVNQTPRYENQVLARKSKMIRRDKRKLKRKFF